MHKMMVNSLKLILMAYASLASARVGYPERNKENQHQRRLCGNKKSSCTYLSNTCCTGLSCHIDGKCYNYPRQNGDPCIPWLNQCAEGSTCDPTEMECRTTGTAVGDSCSVFKPCAGNLGCDMATGKCKLPGTLGEYCHSTRPCGEGLECQLSSGTCQYPRVENDSCSVVNSCADGYMCDLTSSICRGPSELGGTCHLSRVCTSGLYCDLDSQTCKDAIGLGQKCNTYVPCADGLLCVKSSDTCELKCPVGTDDCGDLDDDADSDNGQNTGGGVQPAGGSDEPAVLCNMATGSCTVESSTPSHSPTSSPSNAPSSSVTPSEAPTTLKPTTPQPTIEQTPKCPLTGCEEDQTKIPVDEGLVPVEGGMWP